MTHQIMKDCPFREFINIFEKRILEAKAWKENGGKVIGYLGNEVPEELIIAAGFLPLRICGDPNLIDEAKTYLEEGFDSLIRAQFSAIISGKYDVIDYLVIANSSDPLVRVYYYLRALKKIDSYWNKKIPELYFYDFLHSKSTISKKYNQERTYEFLQVLDRWAGHRVSYKKIKTAMKQCEENRWLLKRFSELRTKKQIRISGSQALHVIGSSFMMSKQKHNEYLQTLFSQIKHLPVFTGVRLFVTGSTIDHAEFYELVESCGGLIIGEDHDLGSRNFSNITKNSERNLIEDIVLRYQVRRPTSAKATITERVESVVKQVQETAAQGVIFYIHKADDASLWDYPLISKRLQEMGVPTLRLDNQSYKLSNVEKEKLKEKVSQFVTSIQIKGGKSIVGNKK